MSPDLRTVFAEKRLRCTAQRLDVYRALASSKSHPTAEQLHRLVRETSPGTSLATVYNTLDALCEAGLARRLSTPGGVARFDADLSDHLHAVADDGQIMDVPTDIGSEIMRALPPGLRDRLESRLGTQIRHLTVQFDEPPTA
jgi:Fe2+ or Zn2+ uptake regulation protein